MRDSKGRKVMLHKEQLIDHMKCKGITFNFFGEKAALEFLEKNNNYFKLTAYRKNYDKYQNGKNEGKYRNLDFGYLVDISTIDMHLRRILLTMCLDIEHYSKVYLLKSVEENEKEDGYNIVDLFLNSKSEITIKNGQELKRNSVIENIARNVNSPYCKQLLEKYDINAKTKEISNFPVWAFVEVVPFGDFRELFKFYHKYYEIDDKEDIGFLLTTVNKLRNAVAHNNCVINHLFSSVGREQHEPSRKVMKYLSNIGINSKMRSAKMSNPRIRQIVSTIYVFDKIVSSASIKSNRYKELYELTHNRMKRNKDYYVGNNTITSSYDFFVLIVDNLYKGIDKVKEIE